MSKIINFIAYRKAAIAAKRVSGIEAAGKFVARILGLPTGKALLSLTAPKPDNWVEPDAAHAPRLTRCEDRDIRVAKSDIDKGGL